jgi:hypothetical protein
LRSYDSDPRLPPSPLSRQQVVSLSQSSCVSPVELTNGREVGGDELGAESYDRGKAWPSINHSILSEYKYIYIYYIFAQQLVEPAHRSHTCPSYPWSIVNQYNRIFR